MEALRKMSILISIVGLFAASVFWAQSAQAQSYAEPECAAWENILVADNVYFMDSDVEPAPQKALLDAGDEFGPFWIQAQLEKGQLTFENKMPGLGLPFTIYHVEVHWLDREGRRVTERPQSFPAAKACSPLSLFPGQKSVAIDVRSPHSESALRMQLKVWVVPF